MIEGPTAIGNHALWVREGDTWDSPSSGTASRTVRPPANATLSSAQVWMDLGAIVEMDKANGNDLKEVMSPSPGLNRRYDIVPVKGNVDFGFTCLEMSKLLFEHIFNIPKITGGSFTYNPTAAPSKKGWFQLQQYRHDDTLFNTLFLYGSLQVDGDISMKDDVTSVKMKFMSLYSSLNTGTVV